jgi:hypothetical protein
MCGKEPKTIASTTTSWPTASADEGHSQSPFNCSALDRSPKRAATDLCSQYEPYGSSAQMFVVTQQDVC